MTTVRQASGHGCDALLGGRRLAVLGLTDQLLHQRTSHQSYAEAAHALEMQVSLKRMSERPQCGSLQGLGGTHELPPNRSPCYQTRLALTLKLTVSVLSECRSRCVSDLQVNQLGDDEVEGDGFVHEDFF